MVLLTLSVASAQAEDATPAGAAAAQSSSPASTTGAATGGSGASSGTSPTPLEPPTAGAKGEGKSVPARSSSLLEIGIAAALDRARSAYQNGRYDQCVASYGELFEQDAELQKELAADALEQARVYYAACLLALGNIDPADMQFRAALERNPLMAAPDPVLFPGQVRDLFFKVKADFLEDIRRVQDEKLEQARLEAEARALRARQERERVRQLEAIAATEGVVSQNRRWIAALPFGVGQFQNDDSVLGSVFLASELLLLGACVTAVAVELNTHAQANGGRSVFPSAEPFNERLRIAHTVEIGAGAALLATAMIGIVQAQVAYVPEVQVGTRPRALPSGLRRAPSAAHPVGPRLQARIDRDQAWLGVGGSF